jgi:hypothetical protein
MAAKDRSILREVIRSDPEMQVRAAVTVLHHALDAADAAELLDMLGLIKPPDRLQQDPPCPARSLRRRLAARRSAAEYGARTGQAKRRE